MTLLGPFQGSQKGSKKGSKMGDKKGSKKCHFGHLFGDLFGHLLAKYGGVTLSGNDPSDGVSNVNPSPMDVTPQTHGSQIPQTPNTLFWGSQKGVQKGSKKGHFGPLKGCPKGSK